MGVGKEIAGAIGKAIKGTVQRSRAKKNAADLVSKINPKITGEEYKKAVNEAQKMKNRVGRNRAMWYGTAGVAAGLAAPSVIKKAGEYKIVKKNSTEGSAKPSSSSSKKAAASKVTAARKEQIAANKQKVKAAGQQYKATTNKEKVAANKTKVTANARMVAANKKKVAANAARYKKG